MKALRLFLAVLVSAIIFVGCGGGIVLTRGTVDSVDKIYYAPLKMNRYIVRYAYRVPGENEDLSLSKIATTARQLSTQKGVKDKYQSVDLDAEFAIGDTGRVGKNAVIILGVITKKSLDSFNEEMLASLRQVLGEKVESWPENRFMLKKLDMFGNPYDFKNCDADLYIKVKSPFPKDPLIIEISREFVQLPNIEGTSLPSGYSHTIGNTPKAGSIGLFYREEAGGKAKKVTGSFIELLSKKFETYNIDPFRQIELKQTYGDIPQVTHQACMKLADYWVTDFDKKASWSRDYFIKKIAIE